MQSPEIKGLDFSPAVRIKSVSRPPEEKSQTPCESRCFTQLSATHIVYGKSNPVGTDEAYEGKELLV